MTSSMCSLSKSIPWISAVVILLITFASFFGYGVFSLLFTSLVLILSTILFTLFSKKRPVHVENFVQDKAVISSEEEEEEEEIFQLQPETVAIAQNNEEAQEENGVDQIHDYLANRSADLYSESESIDQSFTSEDSDVEWPYSGEAAHSPDFSDGSISDEESLIEIALPCRQYVIPKEEDTKFSLQQKLPYFSPEAIFRQHGLMELLAEFNEEENLIEIDISMGSIKCSRFEIEA